MTKQEEAHRVYRASLKREEIREGIDTALRLGTGKTGEELEAFKRILSNLGVVIRVDKVLPQFYTSKMPTVIDNATVESGFFEPLIEDE